MGSYSGNDSVTVSFDIFIRKDGDINNKFLDNFVKEKKDKNTVDVLFDKNKNIQKFFLESVGIDLKDKIDQKTSEYLFSLYEKNEESFCEMEIEYDVSGYYDPGVMSGPPEYCYPPEGDEERTVTYCVVKLGDKSEFSLELPAEHISKIESAFHDEINKNEFSYHEDGPDYDDYDDCRDDRYY